MHNKIPHLHYESRASKKRTHKRLVEARAADEEDVGGGEAPFAWVDGQDVAAHK